MTGSSAAALTGLMFVVIALASGSDRSRKTTDGIATFSTPTVVHFSAALFVSAVLSAPWPSLVSAGIPLGLAGLYGIVHVFRVMIRTRRLTTYTPDTEDWTWFTILPLLAYGAVFAGTLALAAFPRDALFVLAGGVLLLLLIGIRNAWDVVTFLAIGGANDPPT